MERSCYFLLMQIHLRNWCWIWDVLFGNPPFVGCGTEVIEFRFTYDKVLGAVHTRESAGFLVFVLFSLILSRHFRRSAFLCSHSDILKYFDGDGDPLAKY